VSGQRERGAALRLRRITKRFGAKTAVDDVTLSVDQGTVFGLIGPNGAGKTTTFSILAGYLRPTSGEVHVLGLAPTAVDALRGKVGVLPQDAVLPAHDAVGDFLLHMARLQGYGRRDAFDAAQRALDEVAGREWWAQRCGSLSHGMAKRVGLAQALLGQPELVLLDEPTAGLDPRVARETRDVIKARRGRCTIVVSSHNLQELEEVCDAAAILDAGRMVASGTMAELTSADQEVRVKVAPGTARGERSGQVPLPALRALAFVRAVDFDEEELELVVSFERERSDAETVIGQVLRVLLDSDVRISGVAKGRSLEKRVMALT
jgi:ABC-type multidrug transport system ATPase subunit